MEMPLMYKQYETLPFSYFLVDKDLNILSVSDCVSNCFDRASNFLELVHTKSKKTVSRFILNHSSSVKAELHLKTKHSDCSLFDVYTQYEQSGYIHLFCIRKDEELHMVQEDIKRLEGELLSANILLLEKKAELEKSLQEVTELVMKNENLAMVGKLAASIAHEIRNPLTTVKGFIQLLKPYLTDVGKGEYADIAIDELNRANDIIYEFLNASKPSQPNKQPVPLSKLLSDVVLLCESESHLHNCHITYEQDEQDVYVNLDVKQLKQVLLNLIKNAMDAISESDHKQQGKIELYTRKANEHIEIYIRDNGTGIDQQVITKLFIPFFTTKSKGTGIGLAVCAKIIDAHDGNIAVDSIVGEGTTFKITLPLEANTHVKEEKLSILHMKLS